MPQTAPHLVENGDNASITVSFTYYTNATRRRSRLHSLHQRMRGWGLNPSPVGARPALDTLFDSLAVGAGHASRLLDRTRGRETLLDSVPYAHAFIA
jgi:hypothetical protein